jgi:hypothetical protein
MSNVEIQPGTIAMRSRNSQWCGVVLLTCVVAGCSDPGPQMYSFSGVATRNGKPLPKLCITLQPDDRDRNPSSVATTDEEGRFTMTIGSKEGVFPGGYQVVVSDPSALQGGRSTDDPDYRAALEAYGAQSPLHITVDKDDDEVELKLD